jgi:hypothetical protein
VRHGPISGSLGRLTPGRRFWGTARDPGPRDPAAGAVTSAVRAGGTCRLGYGVLRVCVGGVRWATLELALANRWELCVSIAEGRSLHGPKSQDGGGADNGIPLSECLSTCIGGEGDGDREDDLLWIEEGQTGVALAGGESTATKLKMG